MPLIHEKHIMAHGAADQIRSEAGYIVAELRPDGPMQTGAGDTLAACRQIAIDQVTNSPDAKVGVFALIHEFSAPRTASNEATPGQPG